MIHINNMVVEELQRFKVSPSLGQMRRMDFFHFEDGFLQGYALTKLNWSGA